jgi:predicted aspartyl protease
VLDTGASYTLIVPAVLGRLGYRLSGDEPSIAIVTASSSERVPRLPVARIGALGLNRQSFEVVMHPLPPGAGWHGLLGLDFLRDHRLTIDFVNGELELI